MPRKNSADKIVGSTVELGCAVDKNAEPPVDLGICSECGWRGSLDKCELGEDGSWEEGYSVIPLCPVCEDGGCIDDYSMSDERRAEWKKWHEDKQSNAKVSRAHD